MINFMLIELSTKSIITSGTLEKIYYLGTQYRGPVIRGDIIKQGDTTCHCILSADCWYQAVCGSGTFTYRWRGGQETERSRRGM